MQWHRKRKNRENIEIDEIFLDSRNTPGFNKEGLEGSIENPIKEKSLIIIGFVFLFVGFVFSARIIYLQIVNGKNFSERAENNYLKIRPITPQRGSIYDRNGEILAGLNQEEGGWRRTYEKNGFLHVLGFLKKDETGEILTGASGLEAAYDAILTGVPGKQIDEIDAKGKILSSGVGEKSTAGKDLYTSISKGLQIKLSEAISKTAQNRGFNGGAGIFMDIKSGEILALSSIPEFDPNILLASSSSKTISSLLTDKKKPFFNRAVNGLYPPGSIVKPAVAAGALAEKIIDPSKQIYSAGFISLPNPYFPDKPSIFKDWKALGWVDMRRALAMSSDVYFYTIGGGYEDQKGLGIMNLKKYMSLFGFDELTGIDLPGEKRGSLPNPDKDRDGRNWSIGDTYNSSIGQGDILVTPIEMVAYAATIASSGIMPYPHIVRAFGNDKIEKLSYIPRRTNVLSEDIYKIIHEGMRDSVLFGTASGLGGFSTKIAAKTGTAEIGKTGRVHSWIMGYFPYEKPEIAFVILMDNGSATNLIGATFVASEVVRWIEETGFLSKLNYDNINQ